LGGLIRDDETYQESKVPLLGDIPWLGALFRSTQKVVNKQNLIVFLKPTILRDKAANRAVAAEKFDQLWNLNLAIKESHGEDTEDLKKPELDSVFEGMQVK
jgi:general secretion pathway protein D